MDQVEAPCLNLWCENEPMLYSSSRTSHFVKWIRTFESIENPGSLDGMSTWHRTMLHGLQIFWVSPLRQRSCSRKDELRLNRKLQK